MHLFPIISFRHHRRHIQKPLNLRPDLQDPERFRHHIIHPHLLATTN
jgi:hypothetical protein